MVKIVLIDDDPISTFVTEKLISKNIKEPCEIFKFEKATDALERITNIAPNYLFLDLNMPEMNGWEFLDAFTSRETKYPEIYILSSSVDESDINKAMNYSVVKRYLSKPLIKKYIRTIFN
ncbi:response regulator [Litoribacter populi]|uniref:response regulator n=1 Tax=Litoribacter populi TaxID=2598460 RepID=UPI00117D070F|nr:response regulator [Litoribacter populi]